MTLLNRSEFSTAEASRNLSDVRSENDLLTENLDHRLAVMFDKDPDHAKALVWEHGNALGYSQEYVHSVIASYRVD